ncbi:TonB-dependent siderophore receptor [Pseudomonas paralcaligenes]|uniref:TonB-dependent siderophore receptor n=1 Tax=Pseudomonas paralcaligenes TaxID=2772558 RepID=UPI001C8030FC|nr:TonB-dependent receptor [Pseudomonas paralcaligenes]
MSRHNASRRTSSPRRFPLLSPLGLAVNRALLGAALALPVAGVLLVEPAWAQNVVAEYDFAIASGSLESALNGFAATTGVSLSYSPDTVRGLRSPGVQGRLPADQALQRLLAGSGVQVVRQASGNYSLLPPAESGASLQLDATSITGAGLGGTTEGTGSYTSGATRSATKLDLSLRETPQSVTVMTRQRMDDQNLTSVGAVMEQAPGISRRQYGDDGAGYVSFYSRGFAINNYQLNGVVTSSGALQGLSGSIGSMDTAIYDQITVVRGATGLLTGAGDPSASINLVRKKPTAEFQAHVLGSAGTWDRYRVEADVSGPLDSQGNLRGRMVAVHNEGRSWKDRYSGESDIFYGVVELDLTDATLLSVGLEANRSDYDEASPHNFSLADNAGNKTHHSRSDSAVTRWSYLDLERYTLFASLEHQFGNGWQSTLSANRTWLDTEQNYGVAAPDPNAVTRAGTVTTGRSEQTPQQNALDFFASGPYQLFGREHELMLGMNYFDLERDDPAFRRVVVPIANADEFDGDIPLPNFPSAGRDWRDSRQLGGYLATRLRPTDDLSVILGARVTDWKNRTQTQDLVETGVTIPYVGVVYDLNDWLSTYASYTSIFNPQSNEDRDGKTLEPEEGDNYELGLKSEFFDGRLNASVAVFEVRKDNLAVRDGNELTPSGGNAYVAESNTKARGYELEVSGELTPGWNLAGGFTQVVTRNKAGDRINPDQPRHQFKLFTTYRLPGALEKLTVGGGVNWQSEIHASGQTGNYRKSFAQDAYTVVGLMARYQATEQLAVSLNLDNLLDEKYLLNTGGHTYGAPRNLMATAKYQF